ncbi:endonuclease/exonuclease/phosphatase family protein [Catenuloplanes japonicus]|uniref:endonuclease/exonuclease/phosphatase family protein n=1 Tax=Catenuloplanes japonicus TaxID=33876 RepID=UPI0005273FA0|nr:endonuclease/exonuclease/phosphatase family protein [Catenuloplanes japonicus]
MAVLVAAVSSACSGPIRPSSHDVTLEVLGATVNPVGSWSVFPPGGEPVVVAAASSTGGVRSLRLTGRFSVGCGHAQADPVRIVEQVVDVGPDPAATAPSVNAVRQLNLGAGEQRRICGGQASTGTLAGELVATAVFEDASAPVTSPVLRFRSGTLHVANLNIIGAEATAATGGLGTFAERLDQLGAALVDFDIVAVQEAGDDQVRQLAEKAGFPYHAAYPGLGFLSRWELTDIVQLVGDKPGCVLGINCGGEVHLHAATVRVAGRGVRIVNTHLSADFAEQGLDRTAWRAAQAAQIRRTLVEPFAGPVIVIGDFNGNDDLAVPKGPLRDAYGTAWRVVARDPGTGLDTDHCGDRIELILMTGAFAPIMYDGVFGRCPAPLNLSDHPRVSALLAP